MKVVFIRRWVSRDTVALLLGLLEMAERGDINGLAVCFRKSDGAEYAEMTGHYDRCPKDGVNAAMKLSWHLTKAQDRDAPGAP